MDKKPYMSPSLDIIPLPSVPIPLMVSGIDVDGRHIGGVRDQNENEEVEANSKSNPWQSHTLWDNEPDMASRNLWND